MKLTLKEFKDQLALAKTLPHGDARKAMVAYLKSAEVFEADDKGVETKCDVVVEDDAPPVADTHTKAMEARILDLEKRLEKSTTDADGQKRMKGPSIITAPSEFKIPAHAKRARTRNFKNYEGQDLTAGERAYRFFKFVSAIKGNQKSLDWCRENGIELKSVDGDIVTKAQSEGTNTAGGYLVLPEFDMDLIDLRETYGLFRQWARNSPMSGDTKTRFRRTGGLTASFVGEAAAGSASTKTWDAVSLTAKKIMALAVVSNELNEDAAISIGDDLAGEIAYAFANKEDLCGFIGDGTTTYGGIVGVSPRLVNLNGVDDGGGIVLAAGNLFSEFTLANHNSVVGRLPQYAFKAGDVAWYCSQAYWGTTMQKLALAAGGNTTVEVINGVRTPMFLGYPVRISQTLPTADANSQVACLFGSLNLSTDYGDRRQTTIAFSQEGVVGGVSLFETDQAAIRGTERFDINVHDIGTASVAGPIVGLMSMSS